METTVESFRLLSDQQLLAEVRILVVRERTATTVLIASLAEVDARKLFVPLGYSSLSAYCTMELQMSERCAHSRIRAARVVRQFPVALNYLADGSVTLTNLTVLAPHLTARNHQTLLQAAKHKTRTEVERQMAALDPNAPDLVTLRVRLRRETHDRLRRAQELMRHAIPNGDVAEVLDRALTLLVSDLERKKLGKVSRPRRPREPTPGSRHVSAAVRRAVTERDGGRCAFVGPLGRCVETGFLEFHHREPYALGGPPTVDNIELRCAVHNRYEAEQVFGPKPSVVRELAPAYGSYWVGFV